MIEDAGFISGVWCGLILGAAAMALVVSALIESEQRKQKQALRQFRKLWE